MIYQPKASCLNCDRTETEVPLVTWRYQGRELWICPDCMPAFIHERDKVLVKWQAPSVPNQPIPANGG